MRWLKEQMDRWVIRAAAKSLPKLPADPSQRAEVEAAFAHPGLFVPPEITPQVHLDPDFSFRFESSIKTPFARNNTVHGRFFPVSGDWRKRPSVVLVHGWNAEQHYLSVLPRIGRSLARRRMNGVLIELPYHLQRRPARDERITNFISEHIPRMLEATTQAVADLNAVLHWLKTEGSPATTLWGFSLGAWLVGLHLCTSAAQDAAILFTPVSNMEQAIRDLEFCHPIRTALAVAPAELHRLNLPVQQPKISPDRLLLVQAQYDQFVPATTYDELARIWKINNRLQLPQSHISILMSRSSARRCIDWLGIQFES
jgi:dienelactone hydrolase